ncbi:MAG TPA: PAS domain S-box protein [Smithella sp.]|nr:PAS domain S-box protein [Smithella sp.]HOG89182.1 PAS domain S-box protein [Smithella sp.]HOU49933.1 PAS domain S-box protein [Smithella sp.]HQI72446.1 PAS domain S-box protein [Smithella sp.]
MFSIFPDGDKQQTLRIKRFFIAFASYFIFCALVIFSFLMGLTPVPLHVLVFSQLGILTSNVLIYVIIRTGWNKRFRDPSLTLLQIAVATFWTMEVLYYAGPTRGAALLLYLVIFVFGLFKLNVRQFLFLSLYTIAGYATVIFLLHKNHPESMNMKNEILDLVVLAIVLPWFSVVGGYISRLKGRISNAFNEIKENELKFSTMFNSSSDGIILLNIDEDRFVDANQKICDLLGYSREEFIHLTIPDIHPPDIVPLALDQCEKLIKKEIDLARNIPVMKKDKTIFFADISASKITLSNKDYIVGAFRDVTERTQTEEKLKHSEEKYRLLAEHMKDPVWITDMNLKATYISPSTEKLLGYTVDEIKKLSLDKLLTPSSFRTAMNYKTIEMPKVRNVPDYVSNRTLILEFICKEGRTVWLECKFTTIRDKNGRATSILGESRDITERKLVEDKLRVEQQRFRALVEHSSDIIVVVNREGIITYINPAVEKVLGYKVEERIGHRGLELIHPDDVQFIAESFITLLQHKDPHNIRGEMRLRDKQGIFHSFEGIGSNLITDVGVEGVIVNYRDITERKKAEEILKQSEQRYLELSIIDDLTQLYNSRHFYEQLRKEIERSNRYKQPLTLLLLDLDKFKEFNDTYGHVEGDIVLSRLGQVIKGCLRETDSAYRYGGEEFTVILPMTTRQEGIVTAERIQAELRKETFSPVVSQKVHMTVSIGVAQHNQKEEMRAFVHRVDQFMYRAKNSGRDRICSE